MQTVQDFEILVVDDGSEDDSTLRAVDRFEDARIRYMRQEQTGISAARNVALDESRGYYTAVMDDDDLMPPRRLEWQLSAITSGYVGSVGSFVNFDDETGALELIVSKNPTIAQAADNGGAPGHGTWLLRTSVMRSIRYDEEIPSGVDNNFFLRLLRSGYKVAHCGRPVMLRRRHRRQVTAVDSINQGDAAKQALQYFQYGLNNWHYTKLLEDSKVGAYPETGDRSEMVRGMQPYLPDSLVERNASVNLDATPETWPAFQGSPVVQIINREGKRIRSRLTVANASYSDLVLMSSLGSDLQAQVSETSAVGEFGSQPWISDVLKDYLKLTPEGNVVEVFQTAPAGTSGTAYEVNDGYTTREVYLSHSERHSAAGDDPWILFGVGVEEYWS